MLSFRSKMTYGTSFINAREMTRVIAIKNALNGHDFLFTLIVLLTVNFGLTFDILSSNENVNMN